MKIPAEELAYLAGLFDGEGSINISVRDSKSAVPRYFVRVCVQMNHEPSVITFHHYFGGRLSLGVQRFGTGHVWALRHNDVRPFL